MWNLQNKIHLFLLDILLVIISEQDVYTGIFVLGMKVSSVFIHFSKDSHPTYFNLEIAFSLHISNAILH